MPGLADLYKSDSAVLSFEVFPPKTEKGEAVLFQHMEKLVDHKPAYMTCTYGAGGTTQSKTLEITSRIKQQFNIPVASHLTCVGATIDQLRQYLTDAERQQIDYIVALRGDPPQGSETFEAVEGGFHHANELVSLINHEFPHYGVAVAGYPEKHREAPSMEVDLQNLKHKVECGADIVITQLFYKNENFFQFREACQRAGIDVPIIPGLLPVTNLAQIQRITSLCGAELPESFVQRL
ncbi:MAG TPA: methylenetetrahydrofolate reductase [NAD(P)H], partial [Planctomycetaceae bacterium]|nr:methylenetetrahydrofolate reductase [NAD(P)H] [Planctomycetaceae bacterium]